MDNMTLVFWIFHAECYTGINTFRHVFIDMWKKKSLDATAHDILLLGRAVYCIQRDIQ